MKKILLIVVAMLFLFVSPCIATNAAKDKLDESKLSGLTIISKDKAQMTLSDPITVVIANSFWNDLFILQNKTVIRNIDLYMYCFGGDMFAGFAIIEEIRKAKQNGFTFTVYGSGAIGSMAIPIYAVCSKRIAYCSTIFMVHPATLASAKIYMTGADLQAQTDLHNLAQGLYTSTLADYTKLSQEEWLKKIEKDTWFSAGQAKEWGLVDEIK